MENKTYRFVFIGNNLYNHQVIKRVRWWNRFLNFPGMYIIRRVSVSTPHGPEVGRLQVKKHLQSLGYIEQIMGDKF